jgi:hypothetical protein
MGSDDQCHIRSVAPKSFIHGAFESQIRSNQLIAQHLQATLEQATIYGSFFIGPESLFFGGSLNLS